MAPYRYICDAALYKALQGLSTIVRSYTSGVPEGVEEEVSGGCAVLLPPEAPQVICY